MPTDRSNSKQRAVIYHRPSTTDARDADAYKLRLSRSLEREDAFVRTALEDPLDGHERSHRVGLNTLLALVRSRRIDLVGVWTLDRLGDSAADLLRILFLLQSFGVHVFVGASDITLTWDDDPVAGLILGLLSGVVEREHVVRSSRIREGISSARREGRYVGRPLARNRPDPQLVTRLRAEGRSWRAIADQLGCTIAAARRACVSSMLP